VAISGDTIVVGAYEQLLSTGSAPGAVFVYARSGTTWSLQQELTAADGTSYAGFGYSVALDTNTLVVGAAGQSGPSPPGAAYVFTRSGTTWSQQQKLTDGQSGDGFGDSVSISGNTRLSPPPTPATAASPPPARPSWSAA
jgi:hypothetical protein